MFKTAGFSKRTTPAGDRAFERRHEGFDSVALVGGFSVSGLSLACILSRLLTNAGVSALTLLLVLCMVPIAVVLGLILEGPEQ